MTGGGRTNARASSSCTKKMEEIGRAMGASLVWRAPVSPAGAPGAHHEGGTRMGSDPEDLGGEPLRPELGHSEPLRHRQLDLPDA